MSDLSAGEIVAWFHLSFLMSIVIFMMTATYYTLYRLLFMHDWHISIITFLYCFLYLYCDRVRASRGDRLWPWFRRNFLLAKWVTSLLPVRLIKTTELDVNKNYIFGVHPHGTIGLMSTFLTDAAGFDRLFPGIKPHMVVMKMFFAVPILKEICMLCGAISLESEFLHYVLDKNQRGTAVIIAVGGAYEVLDAHPGTMILTLQKRKGFIKIALKQGASLVPVLNYGDNDQLEQFSNPPGSTLRRIQDAMYSVARTAPTWLYGTKYGLADYKPINTVVGKPIDVEKVENPSEDQINELHAEYIRALNELFTETKDEYSNYKDITLEIR
ncbi:2-acylglycerol O-acyltransferase 1-like [Tubulanus polymorphus]|uniref:2-acylglycerol O-acyltransferase 1-like n=1 Tax=Tubulanus polymorphus TaxID=672921 RepID=UPI003DA326ED